MATEQEKRANFSRLFPQQVDKLLDRLKHLRSKSNKYSYAWDQALVHDTFVQIARIFALTAKEFGVEFEVLVDGDSVEWVKPKRSKK